MHRRGCRNSSVDALALGGAFLPQSVGAVRRQCSASGEMGDAKPPEGGERDMHDRIARTGSRASDASKVSGGASARPHDQLKSNQGCNCAADAERARRFGHDFGRVDVHPSGMGPIQRMAGAELARPAPRVTVAGPGKPMPEQTRAQMEGAFGHDFSSIRVHEGEHPRAIGAIAYTQGDHIHFSRGTYRPDSISGRKILGHELTHVVQQRSGRVAMPRGSGAPVIADARLESEADRLGARAATGVSAVSGSGNEVARSRHNGPLRAPIQRFCGHPLCTDPHCHDRSRHPVAATVPVPKPMPMRAPSGSYGGAAAAASSSGSGGLGTARGRPKIPPSIAIPATAADVPPRVFSPPPAATPMTPPTGATGGTWAIA